MESYQGSVRFSKLEFIHVVVSLRQVSRGCRCKLRCHQQRSALRDTPGKLNQGQQTKQKKEVLKLSPEDLYSQGDLES